MVHAETEGNPLFVGEIVRLLAAEKRLAEPATAPLAIPQSVREVIGRRLRHLSDECNSLLALASVLGREFDLDTLAGAGGLERGLVLELLDEGMQARVVSEVPGAIGRMRFAHALIRDAAYHGLTRSRRVRLHRQVGEALEKLYSSDLDRHLAELAHHFFQAAAAGNGDKAVTYAQRAGSRAIGLLAYEEAARLYLMALEALSPDGSSTARLRCELLLGLADAQGRAGDADEAKSTFLQVAELARAAAVPELIARAAAGYGGRFLWTHTLMDEQIVPVLEEGLRAVGETDSVLRVQLLSRLGAALRHGPTRERRERVCEEAVQIARRIGDPATLAYVLSASEAALHGPHTARRRLSEGGEIISLAARTGDKERLFDGHEHSFWAAWELGDPDRRAAELASMTRIADELRQPAQLWMVAVAQATLALAQGRFAEAPEVIERAAAVGERVLPWGSVAVRKLQLFLLRRQQGRLEGYEREVRDHAREFPSPLVHGAVLAYIYASSDRTEEAEALLNALTSRDLSTWHVDEEWLASVCLLAETCAILERHRARRVPLRAPPAVRVAECHRRPRVRSRLRPSATRHPRRPTGPLRGRRATLRAGAAHEREDGRSSLGGTHAEEHGRLLLKRNAPGDRERAHDLLSRAQASYDELGMHGDAADAAAFARTGEYP